MRKLIAGSLTASGLFLLMVVDTLLPGGPRLPMGLVILPFLLLFPCFMGVMHALTGRYFGHLPMSKVWPLLRLLPPAVKAAGVVVLVLAVANVFLGGRGVSEEADFQRGFAGNGMWLGVGAAILAHAVQLRDRIPAEARPVESRWAGRWWTIGSVALGLVMVVSWVRTPHVFDDDATHRALQTRYQAAGWVTHLAAVDVSHGRFFVYLDSADVAVRGAACDSLRQYGRELGRDAEVFFYDGKHQPSRLPAC